MLLFLDHRVPQLLSFVGSSYDSNSNVGSDVGYGSLLPAISLLIEDNFLLHGPILCNSCML
jgi:hypothetical protein